LAKTKYRRFFEISARESRLDGKQRRKDDFDFPPFMSDDQSENGHGFDDDTEFLLDNGDRKDYMDLQPKTV
jgi:hypothetical protein